MIRKNSEYPLQPPRERGTGRAFAFALVMHALLGFFLYHGIQWQNSTPEGAEAELWTEVPDAAIPRPVPPPPAPVPVAPAPPVRDEQADIALQEKKRQQQEAARQAQLAEQQRQQKLQAQQEAEAKRQQQLAAEQAAQLAAQKAAAAKQKQQQQQQQQEANKLKQQQLAEQQKQQQLKEQQQEQQKQAEAEAQKKADAQKAAKAKAQADAAAQAKKLDAERRARLAQMQGLATGGTGSTTSDGLGKNGTGSGSGGTATSPGYSDKVRRAVRPNITWGGETSGLETVVSVRCSPTGTLLGATISRSSGNAAWDDAALRAVQRTDPMPQDINGKTPTSFLITLRPAG